jgi:CRP-like cAMP-binding protein
VIGEIGVFSPDRRRTATVVVCSTDCVAYELTERKTKELYFQNPAFGYAVMQLIVGRLLENQHFGLAVAESTHPASTAAEYEHASSNADCATGRGGKRSDAREAPTID